MTAQTLGVSPAALRSWQTRQQKTPTAERRGRPEVIPPAAREQIRRCYREHYRQWGPRVLAAWCDREGIGRWSHGAIERVIADLREPQQKPPPPVRYEMTASDVMWSEDGTGFGNRQRKQELLVLQDEHSRLKLNWSLVRGPAQASDVVSYLEQAFIKYGAPLVLKNDGDSIFHEQQVARLLDRYGVVLLTSPPYWPGYNGKTERAMKDIKSYERSMRRHGVRGSLDERLDVTMQDLNEDRPRPVLQGRTAREAYQDGGKVPLPDRQKFRAAVDMEELDLLRAARTRKDLDNAHRRAIENVLLRDGLMVVTGNVSHDLSSGGVTE